MRYAQIRDFDVVNGKGIATSLFVQGCPNKCEGCFNQSTWDFKGGEEWTQELEDTFINLCKRDFVASVSILGGEPLAQDEALDHLLERLHTEVGKPIYLWTGYKFETVKRTSVLHYVDYVIDGKFMLDKRNLNLKLRGSSNQKVWHRMGNVWSDITEQIDRGE